MQRSLARLRAWFPCWLTALLCTAGLNAHGVVPRFEAVGEPGAVRDNVVSALAQDAQGFLWVGSAEGLLRFDGYQFKRHALSTPDGQLLPEQFVRALLPDPRGWVWVAAGNSGLVRMELATGHWTRWTRDGSSPDESAPAANTVRALALEPGGGLWIGSSGGLDHFDVDKQRFEHHRSGEAGLPDGRIQSLLVDRQGTLWIGTWKGLARKRPGQPIEALDGGLRDELITLLAETRDGRVLAGSARGKLRAWSPAGEALPFGGDGKSRAGSWPVLAMTQPDDDEIWLGDASGIQRRRAADGELIERVTAPGAAPQSDVRALLRDGSGTVWVGSFGGGLMRHVPPLPGLQMVREDAQGSRHALDVRSVLQLRSGEIWLGTLAGGVERRDRQLKPIGTLGGPEGLPPGRVNALAQTLDDSVWVAVDTQLLRFNPAGRWLDTLRAGNAVPRRLQATPDGGLWVGTLDGLMRWSPGDTTLRAVPIVGLVGGTGEINTIAQMPDGSLWAGGAAGLFRVAEPQSAAAAAEWVEASGLKGQTVLGMAVGPDGQLWVDTGTGLHRKLDGQGRKARFERVADTQGAFGANLLIDERGRIWSHRSMFDPRKGELRELSAADGMDLGTGWFRAYAGLDDGRLLFGGAHGLLVIEPQRFSPWAYTPPVVVTELRVEGQDRVMPPAGKPLLLAPGERSLSLAFSALDFSQPGRIRYRYRLSPLDKDWVDASSAARTAAYTNLEPGRYQLQVQGSNRDGAWSNRSLQLDIQVKPGWWQTRWAKVLAVLAALAAVGGIVRLRTRWLLRRQRELEAHVSDRTLALEAATAELRRKSQELEEASLTDPLTGLRNRRFLERHLPSDVALAVRRHEDGLPPTASFESDLLFFLIDVDHFKRINDERGHAAGDVVLMQMQSRLQQVFRSTDYLVRWGGEEFLIVARGLPRADAAELAQRACAEIAAWPFKLGDGHMMSLTCSVGFAPFPLAPQWPRGLDWHQTVDLADAALYEAKNSGRNRWVGLLEAEAPSEAALRDDARSGLPAWEASGRLAVQRRG